jgi:hypothetical protein
MGKNVKNCFDQITSSAEVITCKGSKKLFMVWGIWVSKDTKVSLYFLNLHKILLLLIPIHPTLKKIVWPLYSIVHDPKNHYLRARGKLTKQIIFAFSTLFDSLAPILTIFLLKINKKSKIGSHYCSTLSPKRNPLKCLQICSIGNISCSTGEILGLVKFTIMSGNVSLYYRKLLWSDFSRVVPWNKCDIVKWSS